MRLEEAKIRLNEIINIKLGQLLKEEDMVDIIKNKGKTGQLLEIALGLKNSNTTLDFEDGELKTNKCDKSGNPKETIFITQVSGIIDDLINKRDFHETHLYEKINNILYVPICKDGQPLEWFFKKPTHINLQMDKFRELEKQLEEDYYNICCQLKEHIENGDDGYIHTSNGKFIQIRSKDSKPYHSIYSNIYGKNVSNKNHAFYFKKDFIKYISSLDSNEEDF
ncbi:MutH/Sau3AI family endonuclease [Clostridium grantii]|uniref:DNA mismatch repair protein MutH n=1 Tax=Clostridium grantii DSM 8605 TaxID=1121316 RepID=A0A1M5VGX5_9CLOT|nr:MutH/Sau3AI family endonuclease [Clostridium grantii]SHH74476.1 DNA mismatch repair protein MutH [Clostridium grantii DSM 8605]